MSDEELNTERTYKSVTGDTSISFREAADEMERAYPQTFTFPAAASLSAEEIGIRRARFDKAVALLQAFDPEFDGAAYRYSELLAEAKTRIEQELERIKA